MAIANLAMATGNIGRVGVGVNPLRGQNNVQGSCDMGSFPHEFPGYRHVSDDATRETVRERRGACTLENEPGLRIPNMLDAARRRHASRASTSRAKTSCSPIPNTHMCRGLAAMECVVVQDLFLNETANYAHVFLPGSTFLEKDGTFTNAERRIQRVRKVMSAEDRLCRLGDHPAARQGAGLSTMHYDHPSRDHGRDRAADADLRRRLLRKLDELGSVQWPCNEAAPEGTPVMHVGRLRARQGQVRVTEYVADRREDRRRAFRCC